MSLRRITEDDLPFITGLRNSPDTGEWFFTKGKITLEKSRAWFLALDPDTSWDFIAELKGRRIGCISLYDIDWARKTASWGRWMIVPELRGSGRAEEMGHRLLEIAGEADLQLLIAEGYLDNIRSLKIHRKLGFSIEVLPKRNIFRATINLDGLFMKIENSHE